MKQLDLIRVILSLLASCGLAFAQSEATFSSKSDLVLVPTTATKSGQPVRGLSAQDFILRENGTEAQIAVFEEIDAVAAQVPSIPSEPHTAQNYAAGNSHQDIVILVLDFLNGSFSTSARMRSYLTDITKVFGETHTPVTLLLLTDKGLIQAHSFSSDTQDLLKAVEQWSSKTPVTDASTYRVAWSSPIAPTDISGTTADLNSFARLPGYSSRWLDRVTMTANAVHHIAEAFRGIPGRKKMIWMSVSFPSALMTGQRVSDQPSSADALTAMRAGDLGRRAWASLSDANIAVYPVDSNGVTNPTWAENFSAEHAGSRLTAATSKVAPPASLEIASDTNALREVAQKTGGLSCSDIPTTCVRNAQADGNHYYLLGFYLHGNKSPGWHSLKVDVKSPGVSVRVRSGFFVERSPAEVLAEKQNQKKKKEDSREAAAAKDYVETVLASPLDYSGVPLRLSWTQIGTQDKEQTVELLLTSPPSGIAVDSDSNMNLDYLAFVRPVGKTEGHTYPETLARKLSPPERQGLETTGFRYRHKLSLPPGRYEVRILLRDNVAARIGTVSTSLDLTR